MSKVDRWRKNFSFKKEDEPFVVDFLEGRDKRKYEKDGDFLVHVCKKYVIVEKKGTVELTQSECDQLCSRGLLAVIGGVPTCNQRVYPFGLKSQQYFLYGKGHPEEGQVMIYEDIKKSCDDCTQGFTEDDRIEEIKKLIARDKITLYFCKNPNSPQVAYTAFKNSKVPCPMDGGKLVTFDRTCIKNKCTHLEIQSLEIPKTVIED